jgi:hypothetical protein
MFKKIYLLALVILGYSLNLQSQSIKTPAPSPLQTGTQAFGLGEIKIEYSRPGVKGRVVFGDVVPLGKVWRTGANSTTKITVGEDVKINGNAIAPGTYGIYTIPNMNEWDVMIYKDITLGGDVANYKQENELFRFKVKPVAMNDKMEDLLFNINNIAPTSCTIDMIWDKTMISFPVTTEIDSKIMKQIDKELAPGDRKPYFAAANYYYENNKDLAKALDWSNKAVENNPDAYWMIHLKAKIQVKMKDYKGAIATAEQSKAKATEDKNDDYVRLNDKLIADAKKSMGGK